MLLLAVKSRAEVSVEGVPKKMIKFNSDYKLQVTGVRMEPYRESL